MATLAGFDASQVEPQKAFDPLPNGEYLAIITGSEMKPTKDGKGEYLNLTYEVIDGPHKNRKVWSRHNLKNSNEKAVQIAQGELSAICRAAGILKPNVSVELHNMPMLLKVVVKPNKMTGEVSNDVKGWKAKGGQAPAGSAPAAGGPAPWKKTG